MISRSNNQWFTCKFNDLICISLFITSTVFGPKTSTTTTTTMGTCGGCEGSQNGRQRAKKQCGSASRKWKFKWKFVVTKYRVWWAGRDAGCRDGGISSANVSIKMLGIFAAAGARLYCLGYVCARMKLQIKLMGNLALNRRMIWRWSQCCTFAAMNDHLI